MLLPKDNEKDLQDIPESVREDMEFITVSHMDEVLEQRSPSSSERGKRGDPMKITQAEFVISAVSRDQLPDRRLARDRSGRAFQCRQVFADQPDDQPQKSCPNQLVPGKTQHLNYYRINDQLYFVDLPGYGFAKVSKSQRASLGQMIEDYLLSGEHLKLVLHIVDLRHPPTADDQADV